jgi:hypothetical protein
VPADEGRERGRLARGDEPLQELGTGAGSGVEGFSVDLSLADGEDVDSWTVRLVELLKRLGAGPRTFFEEYPSGWKSGMPSRRVEVSGQDGWVGEQGAAAPAKPKSRPVKKSPKKKRG